MVSRSMKMKLGFGVACVAFACALGLMGTIQHMSSQGNLEPSPSLNQADESQIYDDEGYPHVDWEYWHDINADIIAWITIPETGIDTAIVQARAHDPQRYLWTDIYGNWNPWGAIYLSAECADEGLNSRNAVIYGHNMGYGDSSMFADVANYSDPTFASKHTHVLIQTPEWKRKESVQFAEIVEGSETTKRTDFVSDEDFAMWYTERYKLAPIKLSEENDTTRITTLITCSYNYWSNERTVVYSK